MLAEAQRLAFLNAMGVDVYRPRATAPAPIETTTSATLAAQTVVLCARHHRERPHAARLFARLHDVLGVVSDRLSWHESDATAAIDAPPEAEVYLVFGTPLARALGEKLSTMQQMRSLIAIVDEAEHLTGSAASKRALWQTLKPVARRLRSMD